jgi:hypothetical protein
MNSACLTSSVYQISSNSIDEWPTYSIALILKKAAAAILENGATHLGLRFLDSECFSSSEYAVSS